MPQRANPFNWPLAVKVPLLVSVLMVFLGVLVANAVLVKLSDAQEGHIHQLSDAYLNGVSTAVHSHVLRNDVWEIFDVLDRAHAQYENIQVKNTIVATRDDVVLAASDPILFPVDGIVPSEIVGRFISNHNLIIDENVGSAWAVRSLMEGGQAVGRIYAEIDILKQLELRRNTLWAMVLITMFLTLLLAGLGYTLVRWMLIPLSVLGDHLERTADGEFSDIDETQLPKRKGELRLLMTSFNAMTRALREREALTQRLVEEEKLAMLGKLASGLAHEVNNPLGGMVNAIDTVRKHGNDESIRNRSLDIIERGLAGIAHVARATLATYKGGETPEHLLPRDLEDLKFLISHKVDRRALQLNWVNEVSSPLPLDATLTRQVVLNLLLNACEASPQGGVINFHAAVSDGQLKIVIEDQGAGIPDDVVAQLKGARVSNPPTTGRGLGAWTVGTLLRRMGGDTTIETFSGNGTKLSVFLPLSHDVGDGRATA